MRKKFFTVLLLFLAVAAVPGVKSLRVVYPNGGETLYADSLATVKWVSQNIEGKIVIVLYKKGIKFLTISGGAENTGRFTWKISPGIPDGDGYRVRIRSLNDLSVNDFSDRDFKITRRD